MAVNKSLVAFMAASVAIAIGAPATADADQGNLAPNTKVDGPTLTFDWPAVEVGVASYAETLAAYTGTYEFGDAGAALQVRAEGGHLIVEAIGGRPVYEFQRSKPLPVIPLSETEFYVDGRHHTRIAFTLDAAGTVTGAVLNPGRWEQKGRRIN